MDAPRSSPARAGRNKFLWGGVAILVIIVLAMGVTLMRQKALPQEPRLLARPVLDATPANTASGVARTDAEAGSAAAPLPSASATTDPLVDTAKPRIVHPRASEPAVARTPARVTPKPDAADGETPPDVRR